MLRSLIQNGKLFCAWSGHEFAPGIRDQNSLRAFTKLSGSSVFGQAADLQISIKCPDYATAGQNLKTSITVHVTNSGTAAAENFAVDLIVSKISSAPFKFAVYSVSFKEDALLLGGREHVKFLGPGQTKKVTLYGNNRIPPDTLRGSYFLGAVVDPGNSVRETNEKNNMDFCSIRIKGGGTEASEKVDIDISDIYLDKHCRIWIKHTTKGTGKLNVVLRERVWVNDTLVTDDKDTIILLPGK